VSGTASIVGCETLHSGDVSAQTPGDLTNIDALLDEANRMSDRPLFLDDLKFKVYVRRVSDFAATMRGCRLPLDSSTTIVYLQADVCREVCWWRSRQTGDSRS